MKLKPENTVSRAEFLIRENYVRGYEGDGVVAVWSQTYGAEKTYYVTADSCTCYIGINMPSKICKHRLAAHGKEIVALASDMYAAESECDLVSLAEAHAESVKDSPEEFLKFARKIYTVRLERLRQEQDAKEKASEVAA